MRTIPRILALSAALAIATPALPAFAQTPPSKAQQQEAATRFKKGLELFKDGDYQAALIEFRRANELAPNYNVLYNIGQVYFQLQDYPNALVSLERYLKEGGSAISASRRADVDRDIDKLKARVAHVEIVAAVPDAEVAIDDVVVGKTPLAKPIMVSAGRHKITLSKTGFTASTRVVEVASGDSPKVAIDPVEQKVAPPVGPVEPPKPGPVAPPVQDNPPPPPPAPPPRGAPIPGIVVTSLLAAGAVVTGALALSASSTLKSDRGSPGATHDQLTGDATKTTALAVACDVMTGGAIIALGVTLYVGLRNPAPTAGASTPTAKAPTPPQIRLGVGGNGLRVVGSF